MKQKTVTHRLLSKGKPTTLFYPLSDSEFDNQFAEIFDLEHYRDGKKKGVFVDIGANIGLTSLYFAPYATKYYAIEPSRACFEALKQNTKGLTIELFNMAILPHKGTDVLLQTAKESTGQTFFAKEEQALGKEIVPCMPIDAFFKEQNIQHVDVLKVDIESSEYVLFPDNSFKNVADKIDLIVGEAHHEHISGTIPDILPVILKKYGFTTRFTDDKNYLYKFYYTNENGDRDEYLLPQSTIFVAERNK